MRRSWRSDRRRVNEANDLSGLEALNKGDRFRIESQISLKTRPLTKWPEEITKALEAIVDSNDSLDLLTREEGTLFYEIEVISELSKEAFRALQRDLGAIFSGAEERHFALKISYVRASNEPETKPVSTTYEIPPAADDFSRNLRRQVREVYTSDSSISTGQPKVLRPRPVLALDRDHAPPSEPGRLEGYRSGRRAR